MNDNDQPTTNRMPWALLVVTLILMGGCNGWQAVATQDDSTRRHDTGSPAQANDNLKEFSFEQLQMAMPMQIKVWACSESHAQAACKKAFRRASELVQIFSDYDRSSEINRLLDQPVGKPHQVSADLMKVLLFCDSLHRQTNGAFDPTAGPVIELWRAARQNQRLPDSGKIESARQRVGFEKIQLSPQNNTVTLLSPNLKLDFGGVAKGYIGDQVIGLLSSLGIQSAYYQAGGDIVVSQAPPGTDGWIVDIGSEKFGHPNQRTLSNCAVSISGDENQFVEIDGIRYSHVVDPRTGVGVTSGKTALVIADTGLRSDAIATAGCIVSKSNFKKLLVMQQCLGYTIEKSFRNAEKTTAVINLSGRAQALRFPTGRLAPFRLNRDLLFPRSLRTMHKNNIH